jgi:hypothetical protein
MGEDQIDTYPSTLFTSLEGQAQVKTRECAQGHDKIRDQDDICRMLNRRYTTISLLLTHVEGETRKTLGSSHAIQNLQIQTSTATGLSYQEQLSPRKPLGQDCTCGRSLPVRNEPVRATDLGADHTRRCMNLILNTEP